MSSLFDETNKLFNKKQLKPSQKDVRKFTIHVVNDSSAECNLFIRNRIQILNSLHETKMAASENRNKISENHNISKKIVETHIDNISARQDAEKIIQRLREAKLAEKRKVLEYQPTENTESLQTKISGNHLTKISENLNSKNSENRNNINEKQSTKISENPSSKLILDQNKLYRAKAKRLKEILLKEKGYCPDIRKKKKKLALCSKNDYKIIGTINKRKRTKPVKEVLIPACITQSEQPPEPELTLSELVRVTDERGLDEEDFMEILTCPSPVWWESDDEEDFGFKLLYIDDQNALIRELDQKARMDDNRIKLVKENTNKTGSNTSLTNKLSNKRIKLENIISDIMSKSLRPVNKNKETDEFKNNETKNNDSNERKSKQQIYSKSLRSVNKKSKELDEYEDNEIINNDCNELNSKQQMKSNKECSKVKNDEIEVLDELNNDSDSKERVSISGLSDFGLSDELINTLENIEIPVKKTNEVEFQSETEQVVEKDVDPTNNKEPDKRRKRKANNKVSVVNNYEFIRKRTRKPNKRYEFDWSPEKKISKSETPKNEKNAKRNYGLLISNIKAKDKVKLTKDSMKGIKLHVKKPKDMNELKTYNAKPKQITPKNKIPSDLPRLTKNPFKSKPKVYASPKSIILNSESTNEPDSIPDTNIKFLDEYKEKNKEEVNVNKYEKGKDGELVTVYQIVTNNAEYFDDIEAQIKVNLVNKSLQIETKSNSHINEFYKTRKRVKKNKKVE